MKIKQGTRLSISFYLGWVLSTLVGVYYPPEMGDLYYAICLTSIMSLILIGIDTFANVSGDEQ